MILGKTRQSVRWGHGGFTLIELLIVVAIIAILAAIAVPNFLQAQTRAKLSRVRADLYSLATAIESYKVDGNAYPPPYGVTINGRSHFDVLSTPVAYIQAASWLRDPFAKPAISIEKQRYSYQAVGAGNYLLENPASPPFSIDPTNQLTLWWWLVSRGPDQGFGFKSPTFDPEAPIRQYFFEADTHPEAWLNVVYDPTNGTQSLGNLYRAGGMVQGFAGKTMVGY